MIHELPRQGGERIGQAGVDACLTRAAARAKSIYARVGGGGAQGARFLARQALGLGLGEREAAGQVAHSLRQRHVAAAGAVDVLGIDIRAGIRPALAEGGGLRERVAPRYEIRGADVTGSTPGLGLRSVETYAGVLIRRRDGG